MIIDVLSLGDSVKQYKLNGNITVGVNDIFKHFPVDYLVLVDPITRFYDEPQRLLTIVTSKPKEFLSQHKWNVKNFRQINFVKPRGTVDLMSPDYSYSNTSTFVAAVHAYKLGAKQINLHGADFTNHKALSSKGNSERILKDFSELNRHLNKKGVQMFCSKNSLLRQILEPIGD